MGGGILRDFFAVERVEREKIFVRWDEEMKGKGSAPLQMEISQ